MHHHDTEHLQAQIARLRHYDRVFEPLHRQMVDWLEIAPGSQVLDADCGRRYNVSSLRCRERKQCVGKFQEMLFRVVYRGTGKGKQCTHRDLIRDVTPSAQGCEDCLKIGDTWVHLRICLICGHVGCCDNSKNKHATRHFHATRHPIMQSFEADERWKWCYVDEMML